MFGVKRIEEYPKVYQWPIFAIEIIERARIVVMRCTGFILILD
jgi:hypothetical protein